MTNRSQFARSGRPGAQQSTASSISAAPDALSPDQANTAPPPPSGGATSPRPLQVMHSMVGRFLHGEVLHAQEIAEFTQERLERLLHIGALAPVGTDAPPIPQRPLPAEDAVPTPQAQQDAPRPQDFDSRPGTPRAG